MRSREASTSIGQVERRPILVLDDDPQFARTVRRILREGGWDVAIAGSVADAREVLERGPLGAAVLDIRLPDGTGIDVLERIHPRQPFLPVLVVSGYDEPEHTNRARALGATFARKCSSIAARILAFGREISVGLHVTDEGARRLLEDVASGELRREILGSKDAPLRPFTIRESEVVALAWEGYSYEGIAARSGMGLGTVKTHATALSRKCGGVGVAQVIWRLRIALRAMTA